MTGLVYFNEARGNIQDVLNLDETPLIEMPESRLRPSRKLLVPYELDGLRRTSGRTHELKLTEPGSRVLFIATS